MSWTIWTFPSTFVYLPTIVPGWGLWWLVQGWSYVLSGWRLWVSALAGRSHSPPAPAPCRNSEPSSTMIQDTIDFFPNLQNSLPTARWQMIRHTLLSINFLNILICQVGVVVESWPHYARGLELNSQLSWEVEFFNFQNYSCQLGNNSNINAWKYSARSWKFAEEENWNTAISIYTGCNKKKWMSLAFWTDPPFARVLKVS